MLNREVEPRLFPPARVFSWAASPVARRIRAVMEACPRIVGMVLVMGQRFNPFRPQLMQTHRCWDTYLDQSPNFLSCRPHPEKRSAGDKQRPWPKKQERSP